MTGYMICTAPRSGSTLLCAMLKATGVAGAPASLFHKPTLAGLASDYNLPTTMSRQDLVSQILEAALRTGRGGTPVFGFRQQRPSFPCLIETLTAQFPEETTDVTRLTAALGPLTFIHLTRQDKLGQALSYIRAEQTGLWHRASDGSDWERLEKRRADGYNADAIADRLLEARAQDADWLAWFDREGIEPLTVTYEALAEDPRREVGRVLTHIGQDPSLAATLEVPVQKLADATTVDWIARFQADRPDML